MFQDLRFGARMLLKAPSFTLIAVITLALGIGANTFIFTGVYAMLFQPLPYLNSEGLAVVSLVVASADLTLPASTCCVCRTPGAVARACATAAANTAAITSAPQICHIHACHHALPLLSVALASAAAA